MLNHVGIGDRTETWYVTVCLKIETQPNGTAVYKRETVRAELLPLVTGLGLHQAARFLEMGMERRDRVLNVVEHVG